MNNQSAINPFVRISQADLASGAELNEKLAKATQAGFFYLEIPDDCKKNIGKAVEFANSYFTMKEYTELKLDEKSGYTNKRKASQVERLILEDKYWPAHLSPEIAELGTKMYALGVDVLKKSLKVCQIPEKDWDMATGGVTEGKGTGIMAFNHYDPKKQNEGLPEHRDFGQMTILFIDEVGGLQAKINGEYTDVPQLKDHFVINFGRAIETLVNNKQQLTAGWHRVNKVAKDRISFGVFIDHNSAYPMYQRVGDSSYQKVENSYADYLKKRFAETYVSDAETSKAAVKAKS